MVACASSDGHRNHVRTYLPVCRLIAQSRLRVFVSLLAQLLAVGCLVVSAVVSASSALTLEEALRAGIEARGNGDFARAIALLSGARSNAPEDDFRATLELAVTFEWSGALLKAEDIYRELLKRQPNNAAANLSLARVLRWRWQFEEALYRYEKLLALGDASDGMRTEAELGVAQIERAEMRLMSAQRRLQRILSIDPLQADAQRELELLAATEQHRLNLEIARRTSSVHDTTTFSAQWTLLQSARTTLRIGAARTATTQQPIATDTIVNEIANIVYAEQSAFTPGSLAWRWRAELRDRPSQQSGYLVIAEASDAVSPAIRANVALRIDGPTELTRRTISGGLGYAFSRSLDSGLTLFVSDGGSKTSETTLVARLGWSQERVSAQAFSSRTLGQSGSKHTVLVNVPVGQYQLRSQFQRDAAAKTNAWFVALNVPLARGFQMNLQRDSNVSEHSWTLGVAAAVALPRAWLP